MYINGQEIYFLILKKYISRCREIYGLMLRKYISQRWSNIFLDDDEMFWNANGEGAGAMEGNSMGEVNQSGSQFCCLPTGKYF